MVRNIIDLLNKKDYYGETERIDIAKGKYAIPHTWKQLTKLIKRIWNGR